MIVLINQKCQTCQQIRPVQRLHILAATADSERKSHRKFPHALIHFNMPEFRFRGNFLYQDCLKSTGWFWRRCLIKCKPQWALSDLVEFAMVKPIWIRNSSYISQTMSKIKYSLRKIRKDIFGFLCTILSTVYFSVNSCHTVEFVRD